MAVDMEQVAIARLRELDAEAKALRALLEAIGTARKAVHTAPRHGSGHMSAAARKKLSLAAKKRWAAARKAGKSKL